MNYQDRFRETFEQCLNIIEKYKNSLNTDVRNFTNFILDENINPFSYLESEFACMTSHAEGVAQLINIFASAVLDDGIITYVRINGDPYVLFSEIETTEQLENYCVLKYLTGSQMKSELNVEILSCSFTEFVKIYEEVHKNEIKKLFNIRVRAKGLEYAIKECKNIPYFELKWADELQE